MSAPRRERLEACLARAAKSRVARWQHYAAVTGSAMALATNASLTGLGPVIIDSTALPELIAAPRPPASSRDEPLVRSVRLAMAGRNSRLFAAAATLHGMQAAQQAPAISPGGVVPLYGTVNIIQPGGWASIYGTNLAAGTAVWSGDFPTSLGGTTVTINGRPAYLSFVSPGQINLQAPDDATTGAVSVVVTTGGGTASRPLHCSRIRRLSNCSIQAMSPPLSSGRTVRALMAMERTIFWARTGIASAIERSEPRQATWSSFSASGSGRRIPTVLAGKVFLRRRADYRIVHALPQ